MGGYDSVLHSRPPSGTRPRRTHHFSHLTDSKEGLTLLWLPAFWALPYRALNSGAWTRCLRVPFLRVFLGPGGTPAGALLGILLEELGVQESLSLGRGNLTCCAWSHLDSGPPSSFTPKPLSTLGDSLGGLP